MAKLLATHSVVDVDRWLGGKAERVSIGDAMGCYGLRCRRREQQRCHHGRCPRHAWFASADGLAFAGSRSGAGAPRRPDSRSLPTSRSSPGSCPTIRRLGVPANTSKVRSQVSVVVLQERLEEDHHNAQQSSRTRDRHQTNAVVASRSGSAVPVENQQHYRHAEGRPSGIR